MTTLMDVKVYNIAKNNECCRECGSYLKLLLINC